MCYQLFRVCVLVTMVTMGQLVGMSAQVVAVIHAMARERVTQLTVHVLVLREQTRQPTVAPALMDGLEMTAL